MSLHTIIDNYLNDNIIVSGSPGIGTTSFIQSLINQLCINNTVIYYNSQNSIDKNFIKNYYPNLENNVIFITGTLEIFLEYIIHLLGEDSLPDYIVIDPGDILINNSQTLKLISKLTKGIDTKLIVTSQIRLNPNNVKTYSTIERWNALSNTSLFRYSLWIRNVTSNDDLYKLKYVDVFTQTKNGNNYDERFIIKFDKKKGYVI